MPKLIEKDFPFAELSRIAERESWRKEIYRPVYYLHKWWAKRLGSVFRGILLGACLEDNQNFWERFYQKNSFGNITVFDPFMGSGVTLGEAIKLGCRVIGRDINPVSFLACKASLSRYNLNEIFSTYQNIERQLAPRLLSYFSTQTQTGEEAIVLYYFLVKIVSCPNCENVIELFKTRFFQKMQCRAKIHLLVHCVQVAGLSMKPFLTLKRLNVRNAHLVIIHKRGQFGGLK